MNEFSDFARMPKPIFKENDLNKLLKENIRLLSEIDSSIKLELISKKNQIILECDREQINRVFFNLIKNSIESIQQKSDKNPNFNKKISIEILDNNDHIRIILIDNGIGFNSLNNRIDEIFTPYFTTKKNGTGLGLSIVNKIINDHGGEINFYPINDGAKIEIDFNKRWQ